MRGQSDPSADPYRTLGLEPGASMAEVKRAYRLLAKAFHPDSAGEAALSRFLAIHEAYDQLKSGRVVAGAKPARAAPAEPWRADPARARAARERARTGKAGPAKPGASSTAAPGGGASAGQGPAPSGARGSTSTRSGGRRHVRKATMGSTSYDEARDPSDATWSGASWYGPSSGEYWIVNPREYADPRKHGPEYQSRARRPLPGDSIEAEPDGPVAASPAASATATATSTDAATDAPQRPASTWGSTTTRPERGEGSSRWAGASASSWSGPFGAPPASAVPTSPPGDSAPGAPGWAWLGSPADDPIRRLGLALVAWPPIGLAAAAAIGDITGCASYSAACGGTEPLLPWLAQAGILGLLLLLPPLTRILAGGAIAVLLALLPLTLVLVAVGGAGAPEGQITLAVLLGLAWIGGVAWAAMASRRRGGAARATS